MQKEYVQGHSKSSELSKKRGPEKWSLGLLGFQQK